MINLAIQFANSGESASGLGAFNLNLKSFIFQLITFVIVLLVLRRWVFPKLIATIEARRQTLEESLVKAKQTEEALVRAEEQASQIVHAARDQADRALADAHAQAKDIISKAEAAADAQAKRLIDEAKNRLEYEHLKLQEQLKAELADLVVLTSEKVLRQKINGREDRRLIETALKELAR